MITIRMIRWFVVWLLAFSAFLLPVSWALGSPQTRSTYLVVAMFGIQVAIVAGWIVAHLAKLESELAQYVENHSDPEAAKKLAEFLRKSGSIRAG